MSTKFSDFIFLLSQTKDLEKKKKKFWTKLIFQKLKGLKMYKLERWNTKVIFSHQLCKGHLFS